MRLAGYATIILVTASWVLLSSPAAAANRGAQMKAARKACLAGDYQKGVDLLSDLFVETKDPTHLFNRGRCYQQNRRYEDAIASFQEFLRVDPQSDSSARSSAQQYISECQALLEQQAPKPVIQPPPPEPTPSPMAHQPEPAPGDGAKVVTASPQPEASNGGSGLRTAGFIVGGLGVAGLVTGALLNVKVNSMAKDLEKTGQYSNGKESDRKTYETLGWVGYGVGAACLTTGFVLYLVGRSSGSSSSSVALLPSVGQGQAGAVLQGAF